MTGYGTRKKQITQTSERAWLPVPFPPMMTWPCLLLAAKSPPPMAALLGEGVVSRFGGGDGIDLCISVRRVERGLF